MTRDELIASNVRHARKVVDRVAQTVNAVVIDPTEFEDVEGWEQPDYHSFWLDIIEAYVGQVVFCDGWEYSTGCCIEFLRAYELGLPRFDERFSPLSDSEARSLLGEALAHIEATNDNKMKASAQRDTLAALPSQAASSR